MEKIDELLMAIIFGLIRMMNGSALIMWQTLVKNAFTLQNEIIVMYSDSGIVSKASFIFV